MLSGIHAIDKEDLENGLDEFQVNEVIRCMNITDWIEKVLNRDDKNIIDYPHLSLYENTVLNELIRTTLKKELHNNSSVDEDSKK